MFAQATVRGSRSSAQFSGLYQSVGVETGVSTANPHQLVSLLFDGLIESITTARGAMQRDDLEAKGRAMGRASRIVEEGLKAGLSPAGGDLSVNLSNLYSYVSRRLMQAHLRNDVEALNECQRLIEPVREAWAAIGARASF